jgi:hypothetical protein
MFLCICRILSLKKNKKDMNIKRGRGENDCLGVGASRRMERLKER